MFRRRVFANENNNNFIDYNKLLNGKHIYNNIKSKGNNVYDNNYITKDDVLNNVSSYDTYLKLTNYYYKKNNLKKCNMSALSINDGKKSMYNTNANENTTCAKKDDSNTLSLSQLNCQELKNSMYPYGNYKSNCSSNGYVFPSKIKIEECNNGSIQPECYNDNPYYISPYYDVINCNSLCNNTNNLKPLFISSPCTA